MHCWKSETEKEKREASKQLDRINRALESHAKAILAEKQREKRANSTRKGGKQATWKWDKDHGKIERDSKGGIDWYRYQKVIVYACVKP